MLAAALCVCIACLLVAIVHCLLGLAAVLSGQLSTPSYELAPYTLILMCSNGLHCISECTCPLFSHPSLFSFIRIGTETLALQDV